MGNTSNNIDNFGDDGTLRIALSWYQKSLQDTSVRDSILLKMKESLSSSEVSAETLEPTLDNFQNVLETIRDDNRISGDELAKAALQSIKADESLRNLTQNEVQSLMGAMVDTLSSHTMPQFMNDIREAGETVVADDGYNNPSHINRSRTTLSADTPDNAYVFVSNGKTDIHVSDEGTTYIASGDPELARPDGLRKITIDGTYNDTFIGLSDSAIENVILGYNKGETYIEGLNQIDVIFVPDEWLENERTDVYTALRDHNVTVLEDEDFKLGILESPQHRKEGHTAIGIVSERS